MSTWVDAFLAWNEGVTPTPADFNRIEGNTDYLKDHVDDLEEKTPQSYKTTDAVTFATLNTGQGDNELFGMDQDVKTSDDPTFAGLSLTGSLQPDTTPAEGQTSLSDDVYTLLPRGWYSVYVYANAPNEDTPGAGRSASVEIREQINGNWRTIASDSDFSVSGTATAAVSAFGLKSDGTNIQVKSSTTGTGATRYYQYSKH